MKRRILDLFCGAGGAGKGYDDAGFDVIGVDLNPMPNFPFEFYQADAIEVLDLLLDDKPFGDCPYHLHDFDAIHASPPCQAYSHSTLFARNKGTTYPKLIEPTRERLNATGLPWVIENVPGSPLRPDFKLCGCYFDLPHLRRVRLFETNWHHAQQAPRSEHRHTMPAISICSHDAFSSQRKLWLETYGRRINEADRQRIMGGVDWMSKKELSESIPPVYTEYIGRLLAEEIERRERRALAAVEEFASNLAQAA